MIASDLRSGIDMLGDMIAGAKVIVPFTGAGISTECGIPDFRSPNGLWARYRPIPFDEFVASQDARDESWRRRFAMEPNFAAARPGRGHRALASLYRAGKVPAIEHDGFWLYESRAIIQYLDNVLPGNKLTPTDPKAWATMQQWMSVEYSLIWTIPRTVEFIPLL